MLGAMVACAGCGLNGVIVAIVILGVGRLAAGVSVVDGAQLVRVSTNKMIENRIFMIAIITCGHSPEHSA